MKISNMLASVKTMDCVFNHTYRKTKRNEKTANAMSRYAASVTHQRRRYHDAQYLVAHALVAIVRAIGAVADSSACFSSRCAFSWPHPAELNHLLRPVVHVGVLRDRPADHVVGRDKARRRLDAVVLDEHAFHGSARRPTSRASC